MRRTTLSGFSLIELIAVVALVGMLSIASASILISTQTRSIKTSTTTQVRQEGEIALDTIAYALRSAKGIETNQFGETCSAGMQALRFRNAANEVVELYEDENGRIASNSGTVITQEPAQYLTSDRFTLNDTLRFSCSPASGRSGALVTVEFTLQVPNLAQAPPEQQVTQGFRTQVYVRTYR